MTASLTQSPAWRTLAEHRETLRKTNLPSLLGEAGRLERFKLSVDGLTLNYALNFVMEDTLALLAKLAQQQKLEDWRARLFAGEKINATENRAALHTALRGSSAEPVMVDGCDIRKDVRTAQERMAKLADNIREGHRKGATGKRIRHVVNIGIGGSDLGPRLAVGALKPFASKDLSVHFVANADAYDLISTLDGLDPAETLFLIVSKTFTTQETLLNAQSAREWIVTALGPKSVAQHFLAVSSNEAEVVKFGIDAANLLPMWDWVGGRFSLWSAVGFSVMLALGAENFDRMLAGAAAMDKHFRTAPLVSNIPVLFALLGIWNINFLGAQALAILPYCERLRELPRYLQQLEMESNGKSISRDGVPLDYATAAVIFGECGTVGQHSFHQWLHQGAHIVPADFIGVVEDDLKRPLHHKALLSNMAAQAGALAFGQPKPAKPQDAYAGNRPSNLLMLDRLDPYRFGMLLALYEHKVFVQSVIWNINPFDQPGVELGKTLARALAAGAAPLGPIGAFLPGLYAEMTTGTR